MILLYTSHQEDPNAYYFNCKYRFLDNGNMAYIPTNRFDLGFNAGHCMKGATHDEHPRKQI